MADTDSCRAHGLLAAVRQEKEGGREGGCFTSDVRERKRDREIASKEAAAAAVVVCAVLIGRLNEAKCFKFQWCALSLSLSGKGGTHRMYCVNGSQLRSSTFSLPLP